MQPRPTHYSQIHLTNTFILVTLSCLVLFPDRTGVNPDSDGEFE